MKITALQLNTRWHEPEANFAAAERLMDCEPGAGLYVLPEMWSTGFDTAPDEAVAEAAEQTLAWMKAQAAQRDCAVAGSVSVPALPVETQNFASQRPKDQSMCLTIPVETQNFASQRPKDRDVIPEKIIPAPDFREGTDSPQRQSAPSPFPGWRNRLYFVCPDGKVHLYDKRNLFTYGGEQAVYTAGTERVIATYGGLRFLLQTCFDLRFPETARNTLADTYDVALYVANWPAVRRPAWDSLLPARAIENQAYCLGVNRTGSDPQCLYDGGSAAFDPYGRQLFRLDEAEQACSFEPDMESLHRFRKKFRVLR